MIQRNRYLIQINPFIDKPVIKVITGIRRCGKSTFLKLIRESLLEKGIKPENILLINKDSLEFDSLETYQQLMSYVNSYLKNKTGQKYLFVDEVQEIEGCEKAISGFLADNTADLFTQAPIRGCSHRNLLHTSREGMLNLRCTPSHSLNFFNSAISANTKKPSRNLVCL